MEFEVLVGVFINCQADINVDTNLSDQTTCSAFGLVWLIHEEFSA